MIRKLFTQLVACKSGEEAMKAPEFLSTLLNLGACGRR